jgi:MFS family permease
VFGFVAGVFVDRWDRRRTLIVANLALALGLAPLLLVGPLGWLWLVYAVAFVEAAIAQFVKPAEGALLPRLVGEDELVGANALTALNTNVSRLLGPALGGLVVAAAGLAGVALLDALSFVAAAALTALTAVDARPLPPAGPVARPSPGRNPWATAVHEWLDSLRQVGRSRVLAVLFSFMAISAIGEGVMGRSSRRSRRRSSEVTRSPTAGWSRPRRSAALPAA